MSFETDLFNFVTSDTTVSGLISTRMYPEIFPQNVTLPAIRYQEISHVTLTHSHRAPGGVVRCRYQFDCWAGTHSEAETLADALRDRVNGLAGSLVWLLQEDGFDLLQEDGNLILLDGGSTIDVQAFLLQNERSDYDFDANDFRRIQEYFVIYQRG